MSSNRLLLYKSVFLLFFVLFYPYVLKFLMVRISWKTQVLFGLEYGHAINEVKEALLVNLLRPCGSASKLEFHFADVMCSVMSPSEGCKTSNGHAGPASSVTTDDNCAATVLTRFSIGGLTWMLPKGKKMEEYLILWVGSDNSAFANVVLTFNGCEIGGQLFICNGILPPKKVVLSELLLIFWCFYFLC